MLYGSLERRFQRRPSLLHDFPAVFPVHAFASGPIILVNNGLAPGGVERQIVNTLLGLQRRTTRSTGFIGLRLGQEPELEFFMPALADYRGFVRNAMSVARARHSLYALAPQSAIRIERQIHWLPWDVRDDVLRLSAEFAHLNPVVVHGWQDSSGIAATYAARLVGVPRILMSSRNVRPTNFSWYRPHMYLSYLEFARCPEIVMINNSQAGAADYADWLDLSIDRFVVKRNGLDSSTMQRRDGQAVAALRSRLGIPADAPVVGSICRLNEEKRPHLWIASACEVAKLRSDCHFVIFGTGPLRKSVEAAALQSGLGGKLHCPGTIDDAAVALSLFDVFLLTSRAEGTPNVILEAGALGIPVVATKAGGSGEAIDQGVTGYLIERPQPTLIANRICRILEAPDWRANVRVAGPDFIKHRFGLDRMIAETMALYGLPLADKHDDQCTSARRAHQSRFGGLVEPHAEP